MGSLENSSSTSSLWATASKEWVIQPKPKPGRKPKKDGASPAKVETEQVDMKGRRTQNRAAQRAFRERKQSQLSELQARIQMYEQGEIDRSIALQNISKRLKEENEKLRQENAQLQAKLQQIEQQQQNHVSLTYETTHQEKKRGRNEAICSQPSAQKKPRKNSVIGHAHITTSSTLQLPSPDSMASTPDSTFSPLSYDTPEMDTSLFGHFPADMVGDTKTAGTCLPSFPSFGCGFCDGESLCVCREITVQHIVDNTSSEYKGDNFNGANAIVIPQSTASTSQKTINEQKSSILDNLPAYQPPVALRKRPGRVSMNSVFPVKLESNQKPPDASCSGDPSNCLACGDDAFGKAFCAAIGNSSSGACNSCPSKPASGPGGGCCGLSGNGSRCATCPSADQPISSEASQYIPTNNAWQKLKAHPNVEFADLTLLAEVVSSRSQCPGPRLVVSTGLEEEKPNATVENLRNPDGQKDGAPSPPPRLVPQEILLECGRRRVRHVHTDGVQEALRLLDAKFM